MDEVLQQALECARFELDFERAKQKLGLAYEDERARVLRVNLMLAEDANDELQEQLEFVQDVDLKESEDLAQELQDRLAELEGQYETTQTELRTCLRDIDNYRAEINALNAANSNSTKLLTEKLALSRELNSLKPELEHLRSQVAASDNALADKLSLQRELASMQVELETERRTLERLRQKGSTGDAALAEELKEAQVQLSQAKKQVQKLERMGTKRANEKSAADAVLVDELETLKQDLEEAKRRTKEAEKKLEEATSKETDSEVDVVALNQLQADLSNEKKALQKAERDHLKKSTEWDAQKEALETKLDAFRNKLRSTKAQLKEAQDELERREQSKFAESIAATKARIAGRAASVEPTQTLQTQNPRKRTVARFDPDMTIGTPGNGGVAKKPRLTYVGDKSTFSITPILNRTQSILPESPNAVLNETINELAAEADQAREQKQHASGAGAKERRAGAGAGAAGAKSTRPAKTKAQPLEETVPRTNTAARAPDLDKVIEEVDVEKRPADSSTAQPTAVGVELTEATTLQPKKKKLLGTRTNIFDDDEADGVKKTGNRAGVGKVRLGLGRNKPKLLAEFSPLKKERRMTQMNVTSVVGA